MQREEEQQPIIDEIIKQDFHGIIYLPTGTGKTRILIEALKKSSFKSILWVCATEQSRDVTLEKEFKIWKATRLFKKVTAICWKSLEKHSFKYDLVILDEIQMITPRNASYFKNNDCKIIGATGSEPRDQIKQEIFKQLNLDVIWRLHIDNAIEKSLIAEYFIDIVYVDIDSITKYEVKGNKGSFYKTEKESYNWYSYKIEQLKDEGNYTAAKKLQLSRARFIYNSKTKLRASQLLMKKFSDNRVISFSKSTDIANILSKNPYHSKLKKEDRKLNYDKFNSKKENHISTVEAANTSLNFTDIEIAFIQQLDSNPGNFLQRIGRALRFGENYTAKIVLLCLRGSQDEVWVNSCIESLNSEKINMYNFKDYIHDKRINTIN